MSARNTPDGSQEYQQGLNYYHGLGRAVDYDKAFSMFEQGSTKGNPECQKMLGTMYKEGKGHTVDKQAAYGLFQKSADHGNSFAQYNLGEMLRKGEGCSVDKQKALEMFQKSVDQGNKYAMFSLAEMYRIGEGCEVDKQKAYDLFKRGAARGDVIAQSEVVAMKEKGEVKSSSPDTKERQLRRSPKTASSPGLRLQPQAPHIDFHAVASHALSFLQLINGLRAIDDNISEFQANQILGEAAKLLMRKAKQFELRGQVELVKAYYQVALYEGKLSLSPDARQQARQSIANANRLHEISMKTEVEQRVATVQAELTEIQKQFENLAGNETRELRKHQEALENERLRLQVRMNELDKRERRLNEFEEQCREWEKKLETKETVSNGTKDSHQLLVSVREAEQEVEKDRFDLNDKLAQAEEARTKLTVSEKLLKEKVECLQNYLTFVEQQGVLPEAVHYRKLLKAVKHIHPPGVKRVKCFISYAWQPDKNDNAKLQAKLVKIKGDLEKAGIEVMLDIHNLEGDIGRYMVDGIEESDRLLLICTPRFRQRVDEKASQQNNLQKEFNAALKRQTQDPKFIIPLILEGDRSTSIASSLPDILSLDLSDSQQYCQNMISLNPKGLIPMILGLDHNKVYPHLLDGYHAHLKSRCEQCNNKLNLDVVQ